MGVPSRRSSPRHLAGVRGVARTVEHVVGDLERDTERAPELPRPAGEAARGLEQLRRLEAAALEVALDRGLRVEGLAALERLAAGEADGRVGEDVDLRRRSGAGELGEAACEEVVARGHRGRAAVHVPDGRAAVAQLGAVNEVVVNERGHVHELHGNRLGKRGRRVRRRCEEDEQGTQALAAR